MSGNIGKSIFRGALRFLTWALRFGPFLGGFILVSAASLFGFAALLGGMALAFDHTPGMVGLLAICVGFGAQVFAIPTFFVGFNVIREAMHFASKGEWPDGLWTITQNRQTPKSPTTLWIEEVSARYDRRP